MVCVTFSDDMISILRNMVGQTLRGMECAINKGEVYGNLRLITDSCAVEISNAVQACPFFDSVDDLSGFQCTVSDPKQMFKPFCVEPFTRREYDDRILNVEIVRDLVCVNDGEYEIEMDTAIVICCEKRNLVISRGWYFSEVLTVSEDRERVYSVNSVRQDWENDGDNRVTVKRQTLFASPI
jgi:hypothetical protein